MTQLTPVLSFNLGKALTLSLYFIVCPGPSTTDMLSCTATSTVPWKYVNIADV